MALVAAVDGPSPAGGLLLEQARATRASSAVLRQSARRQGLRSIELRFRQGRIRRAVTGVIMASGDAPAPRTILVVDDDDGVRESVAELLATTGHVVLRASDGREARAVLRRQTVDVLVLDLRMPGADGFSVLDELDSVSPIVVVHTATSTPFGSAAKRSLAAKVFRVLEKPVRPLELIAVVQEAVALLGA